MRNSHRRTALPLLVFLLALLPGAALAGERSEPSARFQQWGEETLRQIHRDLWTGENGLYADKAFFSGNRTQQGHPAFMWGVGVHLPALVAAATLEPEKYLEPAKDYVRAVEVYWQTHDGIGGYDVLPRPKPVDRYYDDNAWMVLALADLYELAPEPALLEKAKATFAFVVSCEDEKLGGGLYWRENVLASKNTCTNAPAIVSALRLYQLTGQSDYLETARRLYVWTRETLQDPDDGLFFDAIRMNGTLDRRKFSYNSGLMIRANALFYQITGEANYLQEAQRVAAAAQNHWVLENGGIRGSGRFAHLLSESFLYLHQQDRDPRWLTIVERALTYLQTEVKDPNGRYPSNWSRPQNEPLKEIEILDVASAARGYLKAALVFRDLTP